MNRFTASVYNATSIDSISRQASQSTHQNDTRPKQVFDVDEDTVASTTSAPNDSRKRKADMDLDAKDSGSRLKPVSLDSDDDELLAMPRTSKSGSQLSNMSQSSDGNSSSTKLSLLDMMATPRGTQPLPRSTDRPSQGYNMTRPTSRPSLERFSSQVSDDGFTSNSSLENRLLGRGFSREPEILLPLSQQSSGSGFGSKRIETLDQRHEKQSQQLQSQIQQQQNQYQIQQQQRQQQQPKPYSSLHTNVQSYSQKRSGDFANYSAGAPKPRHLPPTIGGYNPTPSHNPTLASLAGSPSLANINNLRSRSSSPAMSAPSTKIANGQRDQKRMTKDGILLSDEQQHVLDEVILRNKSVFFTGSAGTGKSVLLRELITQLRQKYAPKAKNDYWEASNDSVAVTASTGIAACNIGGCTLHSFAGVGLGQEAVPVLISKVRKNGNSVRRWQDTKVLIVDEVSMIDADFLDKLETVARAVRKNESPWGGIQVVLTGDFFQLPPVNKSGNVKFSFEAESWERTITTTIQLMQVFRQKDQTFANMLNEMRLGAMSPNTIQRFNSLTRELKSDDGLRPTELFPLRNQVDEANTRMLARLTGPSKVYTARDRGPQADKMDNMCPAPSTLNLKINSQVMLLRNQGGGSGGLVNGSIGVLIGFSNRPADNDGSLSGGAKSTPLNSPGEELPLVRFTMEEGKTRDVVIGREEWSVEMPNGTLLGARIQIPLGLAWSLSIHKSQGQTLSKVRVDLGKVFEKGQAYVALSRATSLEGLQVLNFDPRRVMVHPKVIDFYRNLQVYKK